jgi:hypothetical protein
MNVRTKIEATGWIIKGIMVQFPAGENDFSLLQSVRISSVAHTASCSVDTKVLPPEVKQPGSEADHSPPSSVKIKNGDK